MNLPLININNSSIANIIFYKKSDNFIKDLKFYNIVFTRDGVFIVIKTPVFVSIQKSNISYSNTSLDFFEYSETIIQLLPKPPIEILNKIIKIFEYMYQQIVGEICVNVYYRIHDRKFIIDIMKQKVTSIHINYQYNKYEDDPNYIKYLQIHSHHNMSAIFSPDDNNDEKQSIPCYFGLIGKLNKNNNNIFNIDYKFRFWNGFNFAYLSICDIFDIEKFLNFERILPRELKKLDNIINEFKTSQEKIDSEFELSKYVELLN
jgi:PRTRC genetic system protein A